MGLLNKNSKSVPSKKQFNEKPIEFVLGTDEIKILIEGIQNTTFKGKDIEMIYNLCLKLQDLYTKSLDNK
tara:strand:+ start:266 stop:475 length:210 start_codon:yes stop_codon:yes gene_type:complete